MSDKLTLRFKTLDQHIIYNHQRIEPGTEIEIPEEHEAIWEELVDLKVAVRLVDVEEAEELLEEDAELSEPPPPKAKAPKKKKP